MLDGNLYKQIIKQSPFGYLYGQLIRNEEGKVINYKIYDTNSEFEKIVNLKEEDIVNRNLTEILASFVEDDFDWTTFLQEIKKSSEGTIKEQYVESLNRWFRVHIFHHKEDYFVVQLIEVHAKQPFFKVLTDNLPFSTWAKDTEGRYITINRKFEEDAGLTFEEIRGKTDYDIWPTELAKQFRKEDEETILNLDMNYENEYFLNNIWYKTHKVAVKNHDKIIGTIGFSINISEEKRAKSELEKKSKFLSSLVNSIPDFIFNKDLEGRFLGFNDSIIENYFGKKEEELIGKTDKELVQDVKELQNFHRQDKEVISEGKVKVYEETLTLVDGSVREFETIKAPLFDENNEVIGILGISRDITHRNLQEKLLKESEEKFRQLAENIDGIFIISENNKIVYVSPGFEKIFGISCETFYKDNKVFINAIHKEDRGEGDYLNFDREMDVTVRVLRQDGSMRWLWIRSFPIKDEKGHAYRTVSIAQDITAIKEGERELDRLRTEFFANLSHEFRTPLNLIFTSLQMLELKIKALVSEDTEGIKKYSNIIRQNSFRLLRLVNNLIDTTKIDAGYVEYVPENHDIVSFIKSIANSVSSLAKEKEIELTFNSEVEEKVIAFDLDKMERIILNLMSNAIKFNNPGGKIQVFVDSNDEFTQVHIKDTGIGIPGDKLSYVFERFKQVQDRLTKVSEGSGIGLTLVKSLVEMHGGKIEVKSTLGEGAEFTVKIPNTLLDDKQEEALTKNQLLFNSRVEKIKIEFSDIYGINI